jgi:hypothetical protein
MWIVGTHLTESFDYYGYLFLHSPVPACGKSLVLEILDALVRGSDGVLIEPTKATLFRTANGSTQLLDEVDSLVNASDLRSVLNQGFKKNGKVVRMEPDGTGKFVKASFPVYAPRALAGIGLRILPRPTLERTFALAMKKKTKDETRERFQGRIALPEAKALKTAIEAWAKENQAAAELAYQGGFGFLDCFSDRTIDVSLPLVAVHEVAYRGHSLQLEKRKELLAAIASTRSDQEQPALEEMRNEAILTELARLAANDDPLIGSASELAPRCTELEPRANEFEMAQTLRRFNFQTKSVRRENRSGTAMC